MPPAIARPLAAAAACAFVVATSMAAPGNASAGARGNPVLAGAWPDPTVIKVNGQYVASATSGEWAPAFRLLTSRDLVHWRLAGAVLRRRPSWAVGSFWAPELARLGRRRYAAYYSARSRQGEFCIGVATARRVTGPYRDRGPRLCPSRGAIDAFPVRDEHGVRYLLWKEGGDGAGTPTAIKARPLTADGLTPVGTTHTLIKADQRWEKGVVEGPAVMREYGTFFLYWAGSGCCSRSCRYGEGVARSTTLLGPWVQLRRNPILRGRSFWRCPGHGTPVRIRRSHYSFLYHAFRRGDSFLAGRQLLLDPISFGSDGWPRIGSGIPTVGASRTSGGPRSFSEDFRGRRLGRAWEWPITAKPRIALGGSRLRLGAARRGSSPPDGAILSRRTTGGGYDAVTMLRARDVGGAAAGGIGVTTGSRNSLFVSAIGRRVVLLRRRNRRLTALASARRPRSRIFLRVGARGLRFGFAVSGDGRHWRRVGATQRGNFRYGVRVALFAGGPPGTLAGFQRAWLAPRS